MRLRAQDGLEPITLRTQEGGFILKRLETKRKRPDGRRIPEAEARGLLRSLETYYDAVVAAYWASVLAGARPAVRRRLPERRAIHPCVRADSHVGRILERGLE